VLSASPTLTGTVTVPTITSPSATSLTVQSAGTAAMTIDTSQNVGIGTTSPKNLLDVLGDISCFSNNGFTSNLYYSGGWKYIGNGYGGFMKLADSSGAITFNITSSSNGSGSGTSAAPLERMRIDSSGNVGIGTSSPNASAILDAQSTTKGVRFPNMTTTQKNAISSPAAGLVVFDTTLAKLCVYSGSAWQTITSV
jgi:hypothetical protein